MHASNKNVCPFQFMPQRFREPSYRELARAVSRLPDPSHQPKYTGRIQNVRPALLLQQWHEIKHAINHSPEINLHQPANILQRQFVKFPQHRYACVVKKHRGSPVLRRNFVREHFHPRFIGNIYDMLRHFSLRRTQQRPRLRQPLLVRVRNRQRRPHPRPLLRQRPPPPHPPPLRGQNPQAPPHPPQLLPQAPPHPGASPCNHRHAFAQKSHQPTLPFGFTANLPSILLNMRYVAGSSPEIQLPHAIITRTTLEFISSMFMGVGALAPTFGALKKRALAPEDTLTSTEFHY